MAQPLGSRRRSSLEQYHDKPILQAGFYTYFADLPVDGFEITIRPDHGSAALPTTGLPSWLWAGRTPHAANKHDVEGNFLRSLELSPAFAERVRAARVDRFHGSPVPNFFRKPYGPGWGLVGDTGYTKDTISAQGISNAFRDAELSVATLNATFRDQSFDHAVVRYQTAARHTIDADSRVHHAIGDIRASTSGDAAASLAPSTATSRPWMPS